MAHAGLKGFIFPSGQWIRDFSNKAFLSPPAAMKLENFCYGTVTLHKQGPEASSVPGTRPPQAQWPGTSSMITPGIQLRWG